ncbi:MAG: prephenate dehydratase [Proteobacteria bacterium]|nr:MAG: prephenate dehydratase [Pseudomonadota bacterium]
MSDNEELRELRELIDEVDDRLVTLFNQRVSLARKVGDVKRAAGEAVVYRPEREARILQHVRDVSSGDIGEESLLLLFRELISACRGSESLTRVAVLGPEGTYSQAAAIKHFGHQIETVCAVSIEDVFRVVETCESDYGVVPVENSTEGGVSNTLDALLASSAVICGEVNLPVRHCLLSRSTKLEEVTEVLAHAQALGQCRRWLASHLPGVPLRTVASNAEAARLATKNPARAAIAGERVAELYELNILKSGIQDVSENTTRFLVVGAHPVGASGRDKTSIVLSARNRPGALFDLLQPLARYDIDMTRIESRPAHSGLWEYLFYVDIAGHREQPVVATALRELEGNAALFKLLGSYPMAVD